MTPDQSAQLKQLYQNAKALRITISAIRAAGGDRYCIDHARAHLANVVRLVKMAIDAGQNMATGKTRSESYHLEPSSPLLVTSARAATAGQIQAAITTNRPLYILTPIVYYRGRLFEWDGRGYIQQNAGSYSDDPQHGRARAAKGKAKAKPARPDPLAVKRGMGKAAKGPEKRKPATRTMRKVYPSHWPEGK